ncbi:hypothetical protein OIU79_009093 [Salix purpurea]|uniref:Uncharacterized protein n=1 Tax=Salix purpurea TaxID=77065 RepID=A0A9Q0TJV6_SALPP|nr:hypothetical protein OIU79_009093 [Salix purpurea]
MGESEENNTETTTNIQTLHPSNFPPPQSISHSPMGESEENNTETTTTRPEFPTGRIKRIMKARQRHQQAESSEKPASDNTSGRTVTDKPAPAGTRRIDQFFSKAASEELPVLINES